MRIFSIFLSHLGALASPDAGEMNGANVCTARLLRFWIADPRLDVLEVFVPASLMADGEELACLAADFLPPERVGQGRLRFYALHHAQHVWADGAPEDKRAILCLDAVFFPQLRAARDLWASGPMPIISEVYALSAQELWSGFAPLLNAPPAPFDALICRARATQKVFEHFLDVGQNQTNCSEKAPFRTIFSHTPLDLERFRPADARQKRELRAQLGWPQDKTIAVHLGRLNPYSKADLLPLLQVWSRVAGPDDLLVFAGEAWPASYARVLELQAARLGIAVYFTGRVAMADQASCFRAADFAIVVAETLVDVAPMTVCEAQACALPVVASDWTGTRDRISHGENGFLVPTQWMPELGLQEFAPFAPTLEQTLTLAQSVGHDETVWEDSLRQLLRDPARRAQMGAAALARARRDSSWERVSQIWLDAWDESDALARAETAAQIQARRATAQLWAAPIDYDARFSHYASQIVKSDDEVKLSAQGRRSLAANEEFFVYNDLQALVRPEILGAIAQLLMPIGAKWPLDVLVEKIAAISGFSPSEARFHLALLRKRGWISIGAANCL